MKRMIFRCLLLALALPCSGEAAPVLDRWIQVIQATGPEGRGNPEAAEAWQHLAQANPDDLPILLAGMNQANDLALNWLRAAVETIVERERKSNRPLSLTELGEFLLDIRNHPRARHVAYELIASVAPDAASKLLPGMLNDPSVDLRRAAVQELIAQGDQLAAASDPAPAVLLYRQALGFARDINQIQHLGDALKKLKRSVDLPRHFGFLMHWHVIGPFPNSSQQGFDTVFPPESRVDLRASYPGKTDSVSWKPFSTSHPYGMVNINEACQPLKEVTAYAYTEFYSETPRPAELRLGCKNAWKIWCNGNFLFGRDEYHRGIEIDQYRMPIPLQAGKNTILVKICQNEQVEDWTKEWEFQLRVCDATGTAILSSRSPAPAATNEPRPLP